MELVRGRWGQDGQACIAMLMQVSLTDAMRATNRYYNLNTRQLIRGIEHFDGICGQGLSRAKDRPELAVLRFTNNYNSSRFRWVIWNNGWYFDPKGSVTRLPRKDLDDYRVTSHLFVEAA